MELLPSMSLWKPGPYRHCSTISLSSLFACLWRGANHSEGICHHIYSIKSHFTVSEEKSDPVMQTELLEFMCDVSIIGNFPNVLWSFFELVTNAATHSMFSGLPVSVHGLSNMPPLSVTKQNFKKLQIILTTTTSQQLQFKLTPILEKRPIETLENRNTHRKYMQK